MQTPIKALVSAAVLGTTFATALFSQATAGTAPLVCDVRDAIRIEPIEDFKRAFAESDAKALQETFAGHISLDSLTAALTQYKSLSPNGVASCTVFLQRVETGGMVQEISVINPNTDGQPIFLYLLAVPSTKGGDAIFTFTYNTDLEEVMALLR